MSGSNGRWHEQMMMTGSWGRGCCRYSESCVGTILTRLAEHKVRLGEPSVAEETLGVILGPWADGPNLPWLRPGGRGPAQGRPGSQGDCLDPSGSTWRRHHFRVS